MREFNRLYIRQPPPTAFEAPQGVHKQMQYNRCTWRQEYVTGRHLVYEVNCKCKCVADQTSQKSSYIHTVPANVTHKINFPVRHLDVTVGTLHGATSQNIIH